MFNFIAMADIPIRYKHELNAFESMGVFYPKSRLLFGAIKRFNSFSSLVSWLAISRPGQANLLKTLVRLASES
jgi:hypothetical protein